MIDYVKILISYFTTEFSYLNKPYGAVQLQTHRGINNP